jgi:hypothetical protein
VICAAWLITLLSIAAPLHAYENHSEIKAPESINAGMKHLLSLADPTLEVEFNPDAISAVLEFIESSKERDATYYCNIVSGLTSAYYDFDLQLDFKTIVDYIFNPDIPGIVITPSSTRVYRWSGINNHHQRYPRMGQYLGQTDAPLVFRGRQFIEITPDLTSGAYYQYNLHLTILYFKFRNRDVIMSVNRQSDLSTVGKKGYVLGSDGDWDYLYSGKTGLTLPALGWVKSYMYDSQGVNVYDAIDPAGAVVRCAVFKWLRAGWSGINMVQKKHILRGLKRFAATYKEILESPRLPSVPRLTAASVQIRAMPHEELQAKMGIYFDILKNRYLNGNPKAGRASAKLIETKSLQYRMTKEEMESVLFVEYMKRALGKTEPGEVEELLKLSLE